MNLQSVLALWKNNIEIIHHMLGISAICRVRKVLIISISPAIPFTKAQQALSKLGGPNEAP